MSSLVNSPSLKRPRSRIATTIRIAPPLQSASPRTKTWKTTDRSFQSRSYSDDAARFSLYRLLLFCAALLRHAIVTPTILRHVVYDDVGDLAQIWAENRL